MTQKVSTEWGAREEGDRDRGPTSEASFLHADDGGSAPAGVTPHRCGASAAAPHHRVPVVYRVCHGRFQAVRRVEPLVARRGAHSTARLSVDAVRQNLQRVENRPGRSTSRYVGRAVSRQHHVQDQRRTLGRGPVKPRRRGSPIETSRHLNHRAGQPSTPNISAIPRRGCSG